MCKTCGFTRGVGCVITIVYFRANNGNADVNDDDNDTDYGLGELFIDETPRSSGTTAASDVVSVVVGTAGRYEAVARRTRSRNRAAANTPPESDEDEIDVRPRGRKRRSTSRTGDDGVVQPSGGRGKRQSFEKEFPAKKRSRPQSKDRHGLSSLPSPPPRKDNKEEDDEVLDGYIKDIAQLHRDRQQESRYSVLGRRNDSMKGIHAVARGGKLPTSCLPRGYRRRWGSQYPSGYFDTDPTYYSDPEKLNPPKYPGAPARAAASDNENEAGPSRLQSPAPPTQPVPPPVMEFRAVTQSAGSSGALEVTVANNDTVEGGVADPDALEIHADEADLLATPILRKTRSFETKEAGKSVRINLGGVQFYVLKGDSRGVREDRRGPYTIENREKQAHKKNQRENMSDQEEIDSLNAEEVRKQEKFDRKRARWAGLNDERLQYVTDNHIYCNPDGDENTTGEGVDAFLGEQEWQIAGCAQIMAREIVTNASLVGVIPATWRATVDAVAAIEEGFDGEFSNEKPGIDPSVDLSLVRAREMRRLNGLWTYVFTKAIAESERLANDRLDIDKELIQQWLAERSPTISAVEPTEAEVIEISDDDSDTSGSDTSGDSDSVSSFGSEAAEEIYARSIDPTGDVVVVEGPVVEAADAANVDAGAEDLNKSAPWEDYQLDDPADVLADADAAGLSRLDQNKLAFLANINHRLSQYEETGYAEDYLFRQLTSG